MAEKDRPADPIVGPRPSGRGRLVMRRPTAATVVQSGDRTLA